MNRVELGGYGRVGKRGAEVDEGHARGLETLGK